MALQIRAGEMRKRLELQEAVQTQGANGEVTTTWTTRSTVWGHVQPKGGMERFDVAKVEAQVTHAIIMRFRPDIALTPKWRIKFGTRIFNVANVINYDERGHKWIVNATEVIV
jgi:SPP1 family predicted phage head-tail adaptor